MFPTIMICQRHPMGNITMNPRYKTGQKVRITPVKNHIPSTRDSALEAYSGHVGRVTDYFWISPPGGTEAFFIYTVQIEANKEIVLHEDEIEAFLE